MKKKNGDYNVSTDWITTTRINALETTLKVKDSIRSTFTVPKCDLQTQKYL